MDTPSGLPSVILILLNYTFLYYEFIIRKGGGGRGRKQFRSPSILLASAGAACMNISILTMELDVRARTTMPTLIGPGPCISVRMVYNVPQHRDNQCTAHLHPRSKWSEDPMA